MGEQPQVVLLGDSVLMDSLANNLDERNYLDIVRINSASVEVPQLTETLEPDLIIYEFSSKFTPVMHALLTKRENTLMMVIDLYCSQVILLNCQLHPTQGVKAAQWGKHSERLTYYVIYGFYCLICTLSNEGPGWPRAAAKVHLYLEADPKAGNPSANLMAQRRFVTAATAVLG